MLKRQSVILLIIPTLLGSCRSKKNESSVTELSDNIYITSYFSGYGSDSTDWSLEISEESIRFSHSDGSFELTVPHVEPVKFIETNVTYYEFASESSFLRIDIVKNSCDISTKTSDYSVAVRIKDSRGGEILYKGCGIYLLDYRLNDVWVLEKIQEREVTPEMFIGEIPLIEIKSSTKEFNGFGGCNRIRGKLFQEREILRFMDIESSKMLCDPHNKEDFFLKQLQSGIHYEIKNNKLLIKNSNGILVVLKKID